jgi:hypothetical protein
LAYLDTMVENRRAPRHRVLKGGAIGFGGESVDCLVRNLSATGAALEAATKPESLKDSS